MIRIGLWNTDSGVYFVSSFVMDVLKTWTQQNTMKVFHISRLNNLLCGSEKKENKKKMQSIAFTVFDSKSSHNFIRFKQWWRILSSEKYHHQKKYINKWNQSKL